MENRYAERMGSVKKSFIREILKVTVNPEVISFAGGLPNPASFPAEELERAAVRALREDAAGALQYGQTEGFAPLREWIARRYGKRFGLSVSPDEILITTGSQQGLDLLAKVFLNKGDEVLLERPGYLGAIQALSIFEPRFLTVPLSDGGVDLAALAETLKRHQPKFFYGVPNFQNPSGLSYSPENRRQAAELLKAHGTLFVEDDPYGELRFLGEEAPSMKNFLGDGAVLLGSFSKIVAPALRLGWVCAPRDIMEKLIVAKQAADLHTNLFAQRMVAAYLAENDLDAHIAKIRAMYKAQRDCMTACIDRYFPPEVRCTRPEGGMFLWAELPQGCSSLELFELAGARNVAFVPGTPFYVDGGGERSLRLNYTNSGETAIEEGISRLGDAIRELLTCRGKDDLNYAAKGL